MEASDGNNKRVNGKRTKLISLMAVMAALYTVGSFLPGFPMLGLPGSRIDLVRALEIGYGLILGPVYGPLTAFLGAIVGKTLTGGGIGIYFTPLAPLTALTSAKLNTHNGWKTSAGILITLIITWLVIPVGRKAVLAVSLHVSALLLLLLLRDKIYRWLSSSIRKQLYRGLLVTSYVSTMTGHLMGNIIFAVLLRPAPEFFIGILPISLGERLIITLLGSFLGVSLIQAVKIVYPDMINH